MNSRIISLTAAMVFSLTSLAVSFETDRTWYLAGEAMKVSVARTDAMIAYAELCDTQGLAAGAVFALKGGAGEGIVELPTDLHSGYYLLSVYTRHDTKAAQRLVAVINPLHKSEDDDIEWREQPTPDPSRREGREFDSSTVCYDSITYQSPLPLGGEGGGLYGHHIIKAHIKNVYDGNTFKASQICPSLSIIGKQIHYFEGKMVNDSTAVFYTYGIHGKLPLVLSAMSSSGISLPIEMTSPFAALIPKELPHLVFHYNRSEVEARSLDMQRRHVSPLPSAPPLSPLSPLPSGGVGGGLPYDEKAFGTHPDLTYNLDEYRQFLTIREVLLEYVICVKNTTINGMPRLIVRKEQEVYNSSLPTLVLIDGMPVNDTERLLGYDARRVHHINIYGGQYTFGNGIYNGILSFVTRSGRLTNYPTEPNTQYLEYDFP